MRCQFSYTAPETIEEILVLLSEKNNDLKLLAGGTDLLVRIRNGYCHPRLLVDIKEVPGFNTLTWTDLNGLLIGPAVHLNTILDSRIIQENYPLLVACAKELGSYQIRNRATVVGNIASASPCSDMAPALLCLEADLLIASKRGRRSVPVKEFFVGVKKTVLSSDELIYGISIPASTSLGTGSYLKLKRIRGQDLGIVGVAAQVKQGMIRFSVSSCAQTPIVTQPMSVSTSPQELVDTVFSLIHPITDIRCSSEYRRFMVGEYVLRLLKEVCS
jgi:carbon-monoxide dehydrogenase medium subunit